MNDVKKCAPPACTCLVPEDGPHGNYCSEHCKEAADLIPADWKANLPTSPEHLQYGAAYDNDFWTENKEALEERFKAWLAK